METEQEQITRVVNTIYNIKPNQKFFMIDNKNRKHLCECLIDDIFIRFNDLSRPFILDGNKLYSGFSCLSLSKFRKALVREFFGLDWLDIVETN